MTFISDLGVADQRPLSFGRTPKPGLRLGAVTTRFIIYF